MKFYIDMCLDDFVVALLDKENQLLDYKIIKSLTKKVDDTPFAIKDLLKKYNLSMNEIESLWINRGPGSFTGSRIAVVFAKTIAQILNTKIYTTTSYKLLQKQTNKNPVIIKANKFSSYKIFINANDVDMELIKGIEEDKIDYEEIIYNFSKYTQCFTFESNIEKIDVLYFHEPQIGGK
ncbi:tRNA (adenosine(37)-N6)-threonylcarbamoyltransferase complex dimerization subunit type 1 TsaB [[Mycoplasma] gypis]|uniref:tRNA (Adenosine(37)-N6)-threonylcarbamoyltransferase complex dimerization subunit type 1 TsaB n=1 Tax=[Mycoplasma] gypis TaxID=92404 RepID=A0ABZ2RMJ2_9BACT|nr:tRNA (adenosine(37)-N6)-threonylcarbamoyltransferase complex dimerization subunit type 1 TsaB [[Mycoplasma] gypis]MBN0919110.1 tRNA (adenosine(37)-N6)-threonylcarbamoyltransferase complex dimerization subunit type 1 TsaB [[Mycoplasma] gypis]